MDSSITFWTEEFSETNGINTGWNYSESGPFTSDHMNVTRRLPESNEINSYSGKSSDSENIFKCEVCKGQFPSESELNFHSCGQSSETSQRHSVCDESPSKSQLKWRYTTEEVAKYKCTVCDKSFNCKYHLEEHNLVHSGEKPHKCDRCYRSYSLKSSLTEHSLKCTGKKFECEICYRSFPSEFFLDRHVSYHAKRLKCDEGLKCSESGFSSSVQKKVTQQMHGINEMHSHSGESFDRENILKYEVGKGQFPSESYLNFYSCGYTGDTSQHHSVCDESPSKSQLKRRYTIDIGSNYSEVGPSTSDHMNVTRQIPESNEINSYTGKSSDRENIFKSEVCKEQFPSESELNFHSCGHTSDTSQHHSVCDDSPSKSQLKCTECNKSFKYKYKLDEYSVVHTGDKAHKCDRCYKSYSWKSNLTRHSLMCTGEKVIKYLKYKCTECDKLFNYRSELERHSIVHTGEKAHKCDLCNRSFFLESSLTWHSLKCTVKKN